QGFPGGPIEQDAGRGGFNPPRKAAIAYRWFNGQLIEGVVGVAGLVAKAGDWYAVCFSHGKASAHAARNLLQVHLTSEPFELPAGFNLQACWDDICADSALSQRQFTAHVLVAPAAVSELQRRCSCQVDETAPEPGGWLPAEVYFNSLEGAAVALLGFGGALRVTSPLPLRLTLMDYARQVLLQYPENRN
ncbi:MAG TPA: WYL domain-containing protein, partial [Anaerolineaceae bacterium]|nr:WYL domain-containing protein [Anaerolineaceae bacterium]